MVFFVCLLVGHEVAAVRQVTSARLITRHGYPNDVTIEGVEDQTIEGNLEDDQTIEGNLEEGQTIEGGNGPITQMGGKEGSRPKLTGMDHIDKQAEAMERLKMRLTIHGTIKDRWEASDGEGKGDRLWWVVSFKEGFQIMIKQWNWEVDVTKNQHWRHVGSDYTKFGTLDEDIIYNLKNARFRLNNADNLDTYNGNDVVALELELSSTEPPLHGSCWETAAATLKKSSKGWFGIYKVRNLWLLNSDEVESSKGARGAMVLDVVLWMWYLMRELEQLYAAWLLLAGPDVVQPIETAARAKFTELDKKIYNIPHKASQEKLERILNGWRGALTQEGADAQLMDQLRENPIEGSAMVLSRGRREHVVYVDKVDVDKSSGNFTATVRSKGGKGTLVLNKYNHPNWSSSIRNYANTQKEFGWALGSHGLRYGEHFTIVDRPRLLKEAPMENSLWAELSYKNGCGQIEGLVDAHCEGHPVVSKIFTLSNFPGTYRIIGVDVLDEKKKIVKLSAKMISRSTLKSDTAKTSIITQWNGPKLKAMAENHQLRLEVDTIAGHLKIKGATGFKLSTKEKAALPALTIGFIEAKSQGHLELIAARATELLQLAVDDIWQPDYGRDDRAKKIRGNWKMASMVGIGLGVVSLAALTVLTAGAGLGVFAGTTIGIQSSTLAVGGTSLGTITTVSTTLPTMTSVLVPIAYGAMPVIGTLTLLAPGGVPSMVYAGVRKELMAAKIARGTLHFAEQYSAMLVATQKCPPGSANDEHSTRDVDDPHACCRRQELRSDQQTENAGEQQRMRDLLGCRRSKRASRKSYSRTSKDEEDYKKSVFLMGEFAKALTTVSDFQCEVVPDDTVDMRYRLRERWSAMERRSL